jgi:hypothetical protein
MSAVRDRDIMMVAPTGLGKSYVHLGIYLISTVDVVAIHNDMLRCERCEC